MKTPLKSLGLYIHIPFCKQKCCYCDFYSLSGREDRMDAYTDALCAHLTETAPFAAGHLVDTVYFGGGTPSYLGPKRLVRILKLIRKKYHVDKDAEITLEANPDSAGDWKALRSLRKAGFNRLSLGMQSADDRELQAIGRIHTMDQVRAAVEAARKAKFENLSLDLIYGLPDQTMDRWRRTVERVLELEPEHLSCYGLKLEEGTPLWRQREELTLPDGDRQADMVLWTVDRLAAAGYEQYEISNFARPGFASRHNQKYWDLSPYLGFGPGAHSDFGGVRYAWARSLADYCRAIEDGGEPPLSEKAAISLRERAGEYVMLGLRTARGLDRRAFEDRYGLSFAPVERVLERLIPAGHVLPLPEGRWRLTPQGFLVSNQIIGLALEALEEE